MRETILSKLNEIETRERVKILLAVESGSRAWGFASPDSDYDVRFLYVRPMADYLRLERSRDVIELPIKGELDINGWDLDKALRLLHASNPTLFEWFSSPIVYRDSASAEALRSLSSRYFSPRRSLNHYLSMAMRNQRQYLKSDTVMAKKYFYVLRPVLACRWILDRGTPPPVLFSELQAAELDSALLPEVDRLLDLKKNAPEIKTVPAVESLNRYLEDSIEEVRGALARLPEEAAPGWEELNRFFRSELA
jgi:predicted nucleotidyltransferase